MITNYTTCPAAFGIGDPQPDSRSGSRRSFSVPNRDQPPRPAVTVQILVYLSANASRLWTKSGAVVGDPWNYGSRMLCFPDCLHPAKNAFKVGDSVYIHGRADYICRGSSASFGFSAFFPFALFLKNPLPSSIPTLLNLVLRPS